MDDNFAAFMEARYAEDEALAKAAYGQTGAWWRRKTNLYLDHEPVPTGALYEGEPEVDDPECDIFIARVVVYDEGSPSDDEFEHIAANDPAHRLADIALKRAILALHNRVHDCPVVVTILDDGKPYISTEHIDGDPHVTPCTTLRQLGTEFSGHPEYRGEEWAP